VGHITLTNINPAYIITTPLNNNPAHKKEYTVYRINQHQKKGVYCLQNNIRVIDIKTGTSYVGTQGMMIRDIWHFNSYYSCQLE
jgi:hypothetical protein